MSNRREPYPNELYHYGVRGMKWKNHKYGNLTAEEYYERVRQKLAAVRARTNKTTSTLKEKAAEYKPRDVIRRRTNSDGKIKFDKDGNAHLIKNKPQYETVSDGGKKKSSPSMKLPSQTGVDVKKEREAAAKKRAAQEKKAAAEKASNDSAVQERINAKKKRLERLNRDYDSGGVNRRMQQTIRSALGPKTNKRLEANRAADAKRKHEINERIRQERELKEAPVRQAQAQKRSDAARQQMSAKDANRNEATAQREADKRQKRDNAINDVKKRLKVEAKTAAKRTAATMREGAKEAYKLSEKGRKYAVKKAAEKLISSGHKKAGRALYEVNNRYEKVSRTARDAYLKKTGKDHAHAHKASIPASSKSTETAKKGSWKSTPEMYREAQINKKKQQVKDMARSAKRAAGEAKKYYSNPEKYKSDRAKAEADRKKKKGLEYRDERMRAQSREQDRARAQAQRDDYYKRSNAQERKGTRLSKKKNKKAASSNRKLTSSSSREKQAARDILEKGTYGNGEDRRRNLKKAGINYDRTQDRINKTLDNYRKTGKMDWDYYDRAQAKKKAKKKKTSSGKKAR